MDNFWRTCTDLLQKRFGQNVFDAFIAHASARRDDEGNLLVCADNDASVRWLEQNTREALQELANQHFGAETKLHFRAISAPENDNEPDMPKKSTQPTSKPAAKVKTSLDRLTNLRTDLTFDKFLPGHANELALYNARIISTGDADRISPLLFLHGRTGMGKTHLSHAIGNHYVSLYPQRRVLYVMARDFMSDVVNAMRLNRHDQFKRRYEGLDLLIIDDIQYIGGDMKRTQEEFFFLFNKLHNENKIIIVTSDHAPTQLRNFPERITSRLRCGIPAYLAPPELELREAILHQKAKQRGVTMDEKVIRFIAEKMKCNVRELEGALHQVLTTAAFLKKPPSLELSRDALADILDSTKESINVDTIKKKVAEFFHLRVSDLSSRNRHRSVVRPRHMAMYLCRQLTNLSLPEIGSHFGDREHSTVLHSCRFVEKELKANSKTQEEIKILEMLVKS